MNIHLLGDSIVKSYGDDKNNFIGGWGDHIASFLSDDVKVYNYAIGGRSTRSFLNEGRFANIGVFGIDVTEGRLGPALPRIEAGDYVFIQFGHNDDASKDRLTMVDRQVPLGEPDEKGIYPVVVPTPDMKVPSTQYPAGYPECLYEDGLSKAEVLANIEKMNGQLDTYADTYYPYDCGATYKGFLKYYIDIIRAKKATPILVTSAVRLTFVGDVIMPEPGHHGGKDAYHEFPYIEAVRQLGKEEGVEVLDLFSYSKKVQEMLGAEDSSYTHSIRDYDGLTIGEVPLGRPANWPEEYNDRRATGNFGSVDNTHQNRIGSFIFAALLAEMMHEQGILSDKLLLVPTKQVPIPEKILPRKTEIAAMFKHVAIWGK